MSNRLREMRSIEDSLSWAYEFAYRLREMVERGQRPHDDLDAKYAQIDAQKDRYARLEQMTDAEYDAELNDEGASDDTQD